MSGTSSPLLFPMAARVGLAALLYVLLTLARAPSVWGWGRRPDGSNPWAELEPRISANLPINFLAVLGIWGGLLLASVGVNDLR
jgi:hypothetical protein